jgi:PST family polysaccharide transporter
MILARLVIPEGHGLYELALRVLFIAAAFRDLGLPFHLMRDPRRPYGTVLAFSLFQSVLLTLGLILIAPAFAVLDPELPRVLRVFAPWLILDGLVVVPRTFFERELRIDRLVVPEIVRGLVVAVVSVGLAYFIGAGVWSFVYADLAAAAVFAGLVWLRVRGTIPLEVEPALVPELLAKSKWLFAIWIVVQFVTYIDVYIVEAFRDTATVGQYARAYMIAFLVPQIVAPRALLPALVEYRDDPRRFLMAFRLGTVVLLAFQVVAGYFLFFNAPKVVAIILGDQWKPAVPLLMVLCFVPFLDVFTDLGGEVLKVRNEDRIWLATASLNLISLVFFGILLTRRFGALGMAWANFLLLGNLLMAWRMSRIFASGFRFLMRDLALVYTVPLPGFLITAALFPADSWPRFASSMAAAAVALAALGAIFYRSIRDFVLERDPGAG